jgi:hypothetical protein
VPRDVIHARGSGSGEAAAKNRSSFNGYGLLKATGEVGSDSGKVASGVSRVIAAKPSWAMLRSIRINDPACIVW